MGRGGGGGGGGNAALQNLNVQALNNYKSTSRVPHKVCVCVCGRGLGGG